MDFSSYYLQKIHNLNKQMIQLNLQLHTEKREKEWYKSCFENKSNLKVLNSETQTEAEEKIDKQIDKHQVDKEIHERIIPQFNQKDIETQTYQKINNFKFTPVNSINLILHIESQEQIQEQTQESIKKEIQPCFEEVKIQNKEFYINKKKRTSRKFIQS